MSLILKYVVSYFFSMMSDSFIHCSRFFRRVVSWVRRLIDSVLCVLCVVWCFVCISKCLSLRGCQSVLSVWYRLENSSKKSRTNTSNHIAFTDSLSFLPTILHSHVHVALFHRIHFTHKNTINEICAQDVLYYGADHGVVTGSINAHQNTNYPWAQRETTECGSSLALSLRTISFWRASKLPVSVTTPWSVAHYNKGHPEHTSYWLCCYMIVCEMYAVMDGVLVDAHNYASQESF